MQQEYNRSTTYSFKYVLCIVVSSPATNMVFHTPLRNPQSWGQDGFGGEVRSVKIGFCVRLKQKELLLQVEHPMLPWKPMELNQLDSKRNHVLPQVVVHGPLACRQIALQNRSRPVRIAGLLQELDEGRLPCKELHHHTSLGDANPPHHTTQLLLLTPPKHPTKPAQELLRRPNYFIPPFPPSPRTSSMVLCMASATNSHSSNVKGRRRPYLRQTPSEPSRGGRRPTSQ